MLYTNTSACKGVPFIVIDDGDEDMLFTQRIPYHVRSMPCPGLDCLMLPLACVGTINDFKLNNTTIIELCTLPKSYGMISTSNSWLYTWLTVQTNFLDYKELAAPASLFLLSD